MVDLQRETPLRLDEVGSKLPAKSNGKPPSYETIRQWTTVGRSGVVLESQFVGGLKYTTTEALARFFERLTAKRRPAAVSKKTKAALKELEETRRRMAAG